MSQEIQTRDMPGFFRLKKRVCSEPMGEGAEPPNVGWPICRRASLERWVQRMIGVRVPPPRLKKRVQSAGYLQEVQHVGGLHMRLRSLLYFLFPLQFLG